MKKLVLVLMSIANILNCAEIDQAKVKTIKDIPASRLKILPFTGEIDEWPGNVVDLSNLELSTIEGIENLEIEIEDRTRHNIKTIPELILMLNNNKLAELPKNFSELSKLKELNLSNNKLTTLPDSIGDLIEIEHLNIGHNQLMELPETMSSMHKLGTLILEQNRLKNLPENMNELKKLKTLNVIGNELTGIPNNMNFLLNLYAACNPLQDLPLESVPKKILITDPEPRYNLNISYTPLAIQLESGEHPELMKLLNETDGKILREPISAIPKIPVNRLILNFDKGATIDLSNLGLDDNDAIEKLVFIGSNRNYTLSDLRFFYTNINLSNNKLTMVPALLYTFEAIKSLDISNNQFVILPELIGQLIGVRFMRSDTELESLDISGNNLEGLPDAIVNLAGLKKLRLFGNKFSIRPIIDVINGNEIIRGLGYIDAQGNGNLKISAFLTQLYRQGALEWYNIEQSKLRQNTDNTFFQLSQDAINEINRYL